MPLFSRTRSRSSEAVSGGFSSSNMASFTSTATAQELGRRGPGAAPGTAPAYAYSSGMGGVPMMAATPSGATVAVYAEGHATAAPAEDRARSAAARDDSDVEGSDTSSEVKPMQMKVRLSFRTDIGGMAENQDNCFIWRHEPSGSFVIGVLDGHGRDVGRLAAHVVQVFMQDWLSRRWGEVKADAAEAFRTLFREAHGAMLLAFRQHLEGQGWTVKATTVSLLATLRQKENVDLCAAEARNHGCVARENGGYLMKRRNVAQPWTCVHGGTSATLVALLEGRTLFTANVGDSSALVGMQGRRLVVEDLVHCSRWKDGGGDMEHCREPGTVGDPALAPARATDGYPCQTLILTADHSPESVREFERMRLTHPAHQTASPGLGTMKGATGMGGLGGITPGRSRMPSLLVVYDSPTSNKLKCSPVFDVDFAGKVRVTGKGRYYKNVRKEWASLVATPMSARFQDALAFTRSIGDFHLQTYGVSHVPDVMSLDLHHIFHREHGGDIPERMLVCLVAASDGVWDNWLYQDVSSFFLNPRRVEEVLETNSAEGVMEAFMKENSRRAYANFGTQADNATCVACYLIVTLDA